MGDHFTMWIKKECPFCVKAREELFDRGVNHTIYIMDERLDELESVKEKWSHKTVPIVVRSASAKEGPAMLIGGYTDLKEYFDGKEND
jgi:glutaredoxin